MTRKPPKDIRNRRKEQPKTREVEHQSTKFSRFVKFSLGFLAVAGALASILGILAFMPRLSIEATGSIRPRDPMSTIFSIGNDGLLPLHDVHASCIVNDIRNKSNQRVSNVTMEVKGADAEILSQDQKMALPCSGMLNARSSAVIEKSPSGCAIDRIFSCGIIRLSFQWKHSKWRMEVGFGSDCQDKDSIPFSIESGSYIIAKNVLLTFPFIEPAKTLAMIGAARLIRS
ncbi:MAG: hypothetical protein ACJ71W_00375 [Terriglobales bacterium]